MSHSAYFRVVLWLFLWGTFLPLECEAKGTVQVRGYYRKDGTYVAPHTRSAPGSGTSSSSSWTPPTFSVKSGARTGYRSTARRTPRTSAASSSLASFDDSTEEEEADEEELRRKAAEAAKAADKLAADKAGEARLEAEEAEREKKRDEEAARLVSDEEENKAATRLKRIKKLIAEKKGVISSNLRDSLHEIINKYSTTAAAEEAKKLLDE